MWSTPAGTSDLFPRPFEYIRPDSIEGAIEALDHADGEARAIAGGQSLVPMLSLGLAAPDRLVDLADLPMDGFEQSNGKIRIGALTRHRQLERDPEIVAALPLASEAARHIGNPRIRNRGTIGGSLSHADPAAELGAVALTYGGEAVIQGAGGERTADLDDFFLGYFSTAVESGELLTRVDLNAPAAATGHGFFEIANRADDFATAAATALITVDGDQGCTAARLALIGVADRPIRMKAAEDLCVGQRLSDELLAEVASLVTESVEPEADAFITAEYRARGAGTCASRAISDAWHRAGEARAS